MAKFKGSGVVFLRTRVQAAGRAEEKALLAKHTPEETDAYTKAMAITWIPLDITAALFRKMAAVLHPGNGLCIGNSPAPRGSGNHSRLKHPLS